MRGLGKPGSALGVSAALVACGPSVVSVSESGAGSTTEISSGSVGEPESTGQLGSSSTGFSEVSTSSRSTGTAQEHLCFYFQERVGPEKVGRPYDLAGNGERWVIGWERLYDRPEDSVVLSRLGETGFERAIELLGRDHLLADVDGDGRLDALMRPNSAGPTRWYRGTADAWFEQTERPVSYEANDGGFLWELWRGDVNGDGFVDFSRRAEDDSAVMIWLGDGMGGFGAPVTIDSGPNVWSPRAAQPGQLFVYEWDLSGSGGRILRLELSEDLTVQEVHATEPLSYGFAKVADFNGDGANDVLAPYGSDLALILSTPQGWSEPRELGAVLGWTPYYSYGVGYFDDGPELDLVMGLSGASMEYPHAIIRDFAWAEPGDGELLTLEKADGQMKWPVPLADAFPRPGGRDGLVAQDATHPDRPVLHGELGFCDD